MRNTLAIIRRELGAYFFSPMVWVIFAVFLLLMGWMYYGLTTWFAEQYTHYIQQKAAHGRQMFNLNDKVMVPFLGNMALVLLFILPGISMRLIAEERNQGTIELLLTRPVTVTQLVLGKYISTLVILFLLVGSTAVFPLLLSIFGDIEPVSLALGYAAVYLMGASFLALGLFASALTESQAVAAIMTCGGNLLFWIVAWVTASYGRGQQYTIKVIGYLSTLNHFEGPVKGLFLSSDLVYFLSFICFFLFLSHRAVDSLRWR